MPRWSRHWWIQWTHYQLLCIGQHPPGFGRSSRAIPSLSIPPRQSGCRIIPESGAFHGLQGVSCNDLHFAHLELGRSLLRQVRAEIVALLIVLILKSAAWLSMTARSWPRTTKNFWKCSRCCAEFLEGVSERSSGKNWRSKQSKMLSAKFNPLKNL